MLTCKVCVGAGSGEVVSGLVLESGMGLGVCVLRDRGGPSHDPDYPELPTGHHRDVALRPQESETREAQLGSMGSWWRMPKHLLFSSLLAKWCWAELIKGTGSHRVGGVCVNSTSIPRGIFRFASRSQ